MRSNAAPRKCHPRGSLATRGRTLSLLAMVLALLMVAAACNGQDGQEAEEPAEPEATEPEEADDDEEVAEDAEDEPPAGESEIVISMLEDADTLDPTFGQTFGGRYVFMHMCEKLYDITPDLEVVPMLAAELPEVSEDGLTATIPLREDATFNDGEPFNAEAVKVSLDRHRDTDGSARAGELSPVAEVAVVDDYTVELSLSEPFAPLPAILADRSGMILSPRAVEELGEDFTQDPVCVGPYRLDDLVVGDRFVLTKSDDYYDADNVLIDRVVMRPIPDDTVRVSNLRAGELDIVDRIPSTEYDALSGEGGVTIEATTSVGHDLITLNVNDGPFTDPLVREAFELSLDRDQINEVAYDGVHTASCQPFTPGSAWHLDDLECPQRDVEAATALLEEAGVDTPVEVSLLILNDTLSVRRGELIQAQANEGGFAVTVDSTESGTLISQAAEGDFDALILTWSGRVDPDANVFPFHHTDGGQNFGGASDPEIDEAIENARTLADTDDRVGAYREAWDLIMDRHAAIVLMIPNLITGWQEHVQGFETYPDGMIRLQGVSVD